MNMQIVTGIILLFIYLVTMFVVVYTKKDTSIGNFTWGGGCLLLTLYTFFAFGTYQVRQIIVTIFIAAWCIRLAYYVWLRYRKGSDLRYIAWLDKWKNPLLAAIFSFGWIIFLNGFFSLVMSASSILINMTPNQVALNVIDYIGIIIWILGFCFEMISDYQMYIFKKYSSHKNEILDTGLWRYSRHPNYFGEMTMWWGIYLMALSVPYGWLTIITPGAITITLLFVTGIPWAEKAIENIPGYEAYKKRTSMIIPWFVKE